MNGVHDMGGMHGFGPVEAERDEPVFHHGWEARVLAIALATGFLRRWNIDMGRYTIEQMPPREYLASRYYERWLWAAERMAAEQGLLGAPGSAHTDDRHHDPCARALPEDERLGVRGRRGRHFHFPASAPEDLERRPFAGRRTGGLGGRDRRLSPRRPRLGGAGSGGLGPLGLRFRFEARHRVGLARRRRDRRLESRHALHVAHDARPIP